MRTPTYDWKRFWCKPTGRQNLEYGGYLVDPDTRWRATINPDVVPFEAIAKVPCLILLGEPEAGKTETIQRLYSPPEKSVGGTYTSESPYDGSPVIAFDLAQFTTSDDLRKEVFGHPNLQTWQASEGRLTLLLDAFDKCPIGHHALVALLTPAFEGLPLDRLLLRIACRTAEWPDPFVDLLRRLWVGKEVAAYELTPLRRLDVDLAARARGVDPQAFRAAVGRAEAVPLATKPITLNFLLELYREGEQLPTTQLDLYERSCRKLCTERPESLRPIPQSALSPDDRVRVAARIAAATIFAQRDAIWMGGDDGIVRPQVVPIRELASPALGERLGGESAIREVVKTGLFTSRGPYMFGWAHQSYAEYLAAQFIKDEGLTLSQIKDLLVHPGDVDGKLVPQHHGTAAWLASLRADVFDEVLARDPEVLLRGDLSAASAGQRAKLVEVLLTLYDARQALDNDPANHARYAKLAHPGLADQLRPYIVDRATDILARRAAIGIAEACNVQALVPTLVDLALDPEDEYHVRTRAAAAVGSIGDAEAKSRLKPLTLGLMGGDAEDQLMGYALEALWPSHLTAAELFAALTPPHNASFFGGYRMFLIRLVVGLPEKLASGDLPAALTWAAAYASVARHREFGPLVDAILRRAWGTLDAPGVAEGFARVALARLHDYSPIVRDVTGSDDRIGAESVAAEDEIAAELRADAPKRRMLLNAMIDVLVAPDCGVAPHELLYATPPVLTRDDVFWLIGILDAGEDERRHEVMAELVARSAEHGQDRELLDAVLDACERQPVLAVHCRFFRDPVPLDSEEARRLRAGYEEHQAQQGRMRALRREREEAPPPSTPRAERIAVLLARVDAGDTAVWLELAWTLALDEDGALPSDRLFANVRSQPEWESFDPADRARIIKAARAYVTDPERVTDEDNPARTGVFTPRAMLGYQALVFLAGEKPQVFDALDATIWARWLPLVLSFPLASRDEDDTAAAELTTRVYTAAPAQFLAALRSLLGQEGEQTAQVFSLRSLEPCWDDPIAALLVEKAKDERLSLDRFNDLLAMLLAHGPAEARAYASSLVTSPVPTSDEAGRGRARIAACALLEYSDGETWPTIAPALRQDAGFGREVVLSLCSRPMREEKAGDGLTDAHLGELLLLLAELFPPREDPGPPMGWVSERQRVGDWRRQLSSRLAQRGTPAACDALRRVIRESPDREYARGLDWTLLAAERLTRERTAPPAPSPAMVVALAADRRWRLIESGEQLLDLVLESLDRLEKKLHGTTPTAFALWNEVRAPNGARKGDMFTPMDENFLSDYVKQHLEGDIGGHQVVFNREVEIRRTYGDDPGERTDILVTAPLPGARDEDPRAVIEVKGSWNRHVDTAMETQLVDRYLADSEYRYGLYLVGWYTCEQWDQGDHRRRDAEKFGSTLEVAGAKLAQQAEQLSQGGKVVRARVLNVALSRRSP